MKSKKKLWLIAGIAVAVIIAVTLCIVLKPEKKRDTPLFTDTPSTQQQTVEIDDLGNGQTSCDSDTEFFIEPDESEADRIIEEHKKATETVSKPQAEKGKSKATQKITKKEPETETFTESKKQLESTAEKYLKEHNINPKTAGETGETCPHCGKKIWDPDKYGLCIPGMPDNYENSGYCLGTCGIKLD